MAIRLKRIFVGIVGVPVLAASMFMLVATASALLPSAGRPQAMLADAPAVYICASLAHSDIVLPLADHGAGWRTAFPEAVADMPDEAYISIGWGDFGFYTQTPTWSDIKIPTALKALSGAGPVALRVIAVREPLNNQDCQPLVVDSEGRSAIVKAVLDTRLSDTAGASVLLLANPDGSTWYAAKGRYSPWRTCNVWTSQILRQAGLPTAWWAPFSFGVTWPLRNAGSNRIGERLAHDRQ